MGGESCFRYKVMITGQDRTKSGIGPVDLFVKCFVIFLFLVFFYGNIKILYPISLAFEVD